MYPVGEKRLEYPTVIFFANGEIKGVHVGATDNESFDSKEEEKLVKIYNSYIDNMGSNMCTMDTTC